MSGPDTSDSQAPPRVEADHLEYADDRRRARAWARENPGNAAIRNALLQRVLSAADEELRGGGTILDIGCGAGWWLDLFRERGVEPSRLHGIDPLRERIETGRAMLPRADLRVGDARKLPYGNAEFALAIFITVLSDLPTGRDVEVVLREAERVLAPGGLLLCYEPRVPNPLNPHTRRVSKSDFDRVLGSGWKGTALTVLPPLSRRLGRLTEAAYPALARVPPLLTHRFVEYRKRR